MSLNKLWTLAWRDLGRNRRRTLLTMLAVALGLALLMSMNGFIAGVTEETIEHSIRLRTGHVQLRAPSYEEDTLSLKATDLLENPAALAARAAALPDVQAATPVLWANAVLVTGDDSVGVQLFGIDPASPVHASIRSATVGGDFLAPDDRNGIVIGKALADSLGIAVGQNVLLTVIDADDRPHDGVFTVRGLFATGIPSYDQSAALLPLAAAQGFTAAGRHASAIVVLLRDQNAADQVAAALRSPETATLTWRDLNHEFLQTMQVAAGFYLVLDAIVILIVAVILANTLLMAVFERIREIGIFGALGMRRGMVLRLFLLEAGLLGLVGIAVGSALGTAVVGYLSTRGIPIGDRTASVGGSTLALGTTVHAHFAPGTFAALAVATLVIVVLAALYPAWYAARLEPVVALRAE
jgi:ABC-type lipoprotein release transport system permease subunit